jgi:hypothetical protein
MKALADSLMRIWFAKSRVPHLTGWGTNGSTTLAGSMYESVLVLTGVARRSAPTVLVIVLNLFR